eukprot:TRINITY_DN4595_c0_g2_i1.p1 TRINITY_DN4595_c0_g2~~TRINITY_DN4595_c0_g2_i1.p1  ORF type:complete len:611 (-),score=146.01 TRINITY_DN4595_c0_g2_i1:430-2262(-)
MAESIAVLVPAEHIGKVIGKAGAGLKQVRELTGCKVQVSQTDNEENETTRRVELSGVPEQLCVAFQLLLNKAFADPGSTPSVLISADKAGQAVGKGGENLRRIREMCHVRVSVEREAVTNPATNIQERKVTMQGEPMQMARALRAVIGDRSCLMMLLPPGPPMSVGMGPPLAGPFGLSQVRGKSMDAEELQVHMSIPERFAGVVLGKAGAQVKKTAEMAHCKVSMTHRDGGGDRRVVIIGNYSQCAVAQRMIHEQVREAAKSVGLEVAESYVIMMVRKEAAGAVIGKQGASLKSIRDQLPNLKIQLVRDEVEGHRPCSIVGPFEAVLEAEKLIYELVRTVPVEPHTGVGPFGVYDVSRVPPAGAPFAPSALSNGPASNQKRFGTEETSETKILVPSQSAGVVIGKQGSGLKEIRESCGCQVEMMQQAQAPHWPNERVVILRGTSTARRTAVGRVMQAAFQMQAECALKILVPPNLAGSVIGKQGNNLKRIREQCGVSVQVDREEVLGDRLVSANGPHQPVLQAAAFILEAIDGSMPRQRSDSHSQAQATQSHAAMAAQPPMQAQQPQQPQAQQAPQQQMLQAPMAYAQFPAPAGAVLASGQVVGLQPFYR